MIRPYKHHPDKWLVEWYIPGGKGKRGSKVITGSEEIALAYEAEMRRKHPDPVLINPKIVSVTSEFYAYYKNNRLESTYDDCLKSFRHLLKVIGNYRFTDLSPAVIESYKAKRLADGRGKRTINKELAYLSSFMKWCVKNNHCNPLPFKIEIFTKVKSPKPEVPSPEAVQAIIDKIEKKYLAIIFLLYDTGLRRTEALTLRAENVNLDTRLMMVKGKGEKERMVPIITDRLYRELSKAKDKVERGFLFVNPRTKKPFRDIRMAIKRAAVAAGLNHLRVYPHLFRHSFGTHATIAGVGLKHLQDVMGHCTSQVTEMYTHLAANSLREETQKFARYIDEQKKPEVVKKKRKSKASI